MCISWIPSLIEPAFPCWMSCQFEWPRFSESHSAGIEKGSGMVICWSIYLALGRWVICLKIVPSETKKILCWTPLLSKWTSWWQIDNKLMKDTWDRKKEVNAGCCQNVLGMKQHQWTLEVTEGSDCSLRLLDCWDMSALYLMQPCHIYLIVRHERDLLRFSPSSSCFKQASHGACQNPPAFTR